MIQPTVGRIVWFYPNPGEPFARIGSDPLMGAVCGIHSERCVNLVIWDAIGVQHQRTSVHLVQPEDDEWTAGEHCKWMPYQIGQAARTEQAEAKVQEIKEATPLVADEDSSPDYEGSVARVEADQIP